MPDDSSSTRDALGLHLLVLGCQAGDERAFRRLFERFAPRTLRYLRGLLGDDAEDAQQEVWLSVYRSIATLADPAAFRTWLFSTTRHRAMDHLRRSQRERELIDDADDRAESIEEIPDEQALRAFSLDNVGDALSGLPPAQREVLLLRFEDDLSYAEIAVVVGCPIGTVRTRIHHAKRKLQLLRTGDDR